VRKMCNLYSWSASGEDMRVYAEKAVYDDPLSFCNVSLTKYEVEKIGLYGQG
jgi:hypothetical protein